MPSLSKTRLVVVLILLMALSAGMSVFRTLSLRRASTATLDVQKIDSDRSTSLSTRHPSPSSLRGWAESWVDAGILTVQGLNLVLTLIVVVLLCRDGRYRHTLFAKAFRSSPLSISITTLSDGRYVDVNHAFLQMFGYERRDVIGRTTADLGIWVNPEDRAKMLEQLGTATVSKGLHTKMRTSSGEVREANVSAEMIEVDGRSCVLAVTQDVTEARRMENQLRQAQRMGAVGRLAGGVAHDFNNILTVIIGYSELASYRLGPDHGVSKHLGEIKLAAERAASLTRQLLAFSRQQVLYPRMLDLNSVVKNLMQMLLRTIGEDISFSFKPGTVGCIKADMGQVEQILMNLVVNARDAMPDGGSIAIETSRADLDDGYLDSHLSVRPGRYVMLSISDTGCGIDEKTLPQIFEPFFTTKVPGQGTGLGLATVYGIVKQSEGYIWAYSEAGLGTTFKIYFPEHEPDAHNPVRTAPMPDLVVGTETILVVEDDEALRKLITGLLETSGYKVLAAADGEAALKLMKTGDQQVDLLLTDILMPVMSGVELAAQLRRLWPHVKVLLMSGYAGDLVARYKVAESDMTLIEKPFTRHGLLSRIRAALQ